MKDVRAMVVESAKSLATYRPSVSFSTGPAGLGRAIEALYCTYLSNPSDILHPIIRRETQIFVQPEPHIVAV